MAVCPFYDGPICSLCCSLDAHCHDTCKKSVSDLLQKKSHYFGGSFARKLQHQGFLKTRVDPRRAACITQNSECRLIRTSGRSGGYQLRRVRAPGAKRQLQSQPVANPVGVGATSTRGQVSGSLITRGPWPALQLRYECSGVRSTVLK